MLRAAYVNRISSSGKFEIAPHARLRTAANRTGKFENADPTRVGDNLPKRRRKLDCGGWESPSGLKLGYPESAACGSGLRRAYRPDRSCGRVAEGGGLLNRYRVVKPYRGFESLRLRHFDDPQRQPVLRLFSHQPSSLDASRLAGVSQLRFHLLKHLGSLLEQAKRARQTGFAAELSKAAIRSPMMRRPRRP